jgi:hypothetical protein
MATLLPMILLASLQSFANGIPQSTTGNKDCDALLKRVVSIASNGSIENLQIVSVKQKPGDGGVGYIDINTKIVAFKADETSGQATVRYVDSTLDESGKGGMCFVDSMTIK